MSNEERFKGFKKELIAENEEKYGREIREMFGKETVRQSNERVKKMGKAEHENIIKIENELIETLKIAMQAGDPAGELGQKAADLHRQWLSFYWGSYNKEAHAGLVRMYVADERFKQYYDKSQPGTAEFLRNAVLFYTGMSE